MVNKTILKALRGFGLLAAILVLSVSGCTKTGDDKAKRPNILLIIGDDIGIDVTTNMYPGMIENLV